MNPFPKAANNLINSGVFTGKSVWRGLDRTTRWTLLGMWDQADETLYLEMKESRPDLKPAPYFSRANPALQREAQANKEARKLAAKAEREAKYAKRAAKVNSNSQKDAE